MRCIGGMLFGALVFGGFLSGCATFSSNSKQGRNNSSPKDNIVYALNNGFELKGDWHPATANFRGKTIRPVCIVIHGGGWYKGDKTDMTSVSERLADQGVSVFNINYRLSPTHQFPASVYDIKDAIRWVKLNAKFLGVDDDKICLFGYSAGAHLALMAGFTRKEDGFDDVLHAGIISPTLGDPKVRLSVPTSDLSVAAIIAGGAPSDLTSGDYNEYYEKYFGSPPSVIPETYRRASSVFYVRAGQPPLFLYHGKNDWIVDVNQSRRLVDRIRAVGAEVDYHELYFGHVATFLFDTNELDLTLDFLDSKLKNK